jgi:hypothetical protein
MLFLHYSALTLSFIGLSGSKQVQFNIKVNTSSSTDFDLLAGKKLVRNKWIWHVFQQGIDQDT